MQAEVAGIRAELAVLKWHAGLLQEAIEMRKELDAIKAEAAKLRQQPPPQQQPAKDKATEAIDAAIAAVEADDAATTEVVLNNSGPKLTGDRVTRLCAALGRNSHVASLELANCALGNDQARAVAAAVAACRPLRRLNLETNAIGADGVRALAGALRGNAALTELRLANQSQPLGPAAEKELAAAVDASTAIVVCGHHCRDAVARMTIERAVMRNKDLLRKARSPAPAVPAPKAAATIPVAAAKTTPSPPGSPLAPEEPGVSPSPAVAREAQQMPRQPTPYPDGVVAGRPSATVVGARTVMTTAPAPAPAAKPAHAAPTKPAPAHTAPAAPTKVGTTTLGHATKATPAAAAVAAPAAKTAPATAAPAVPAPAAKTATPPAAGRMLPYAELLKKPKDIDPAKMETYLSDEEFKTVLKMGRDEFYRMPTWKQQQAKRLAKLF